MYYIQPLSYKPRHELKQRHKKEKYLLIGTYLII